MSREQERRDAWTQARHSEMEGRRPPRGFDSYDLMQRRLHELKAAHRRVQARKQREEGS